MEINSLVEISKKFNAGWAGSWWSKCWVPDDLVDSQKEENYILQQNTFPEDE